VPGLAALSARLFGLARRPLPRWRRDTFLRAWSRSAQAGGGPGARGADAVRRVVLFADCLGNHFEPEGLHAAVRVLEAAGLRVEPARPAPGDPRPGRPLCCGRSYLSAGLVDRARAEAARTVAALAPLVEEGADVVGLEPACLLTMRDEFRWLGLGDAAQALAGRALLFEEFLVRERAAQRPMPVFLRSPWQRALLHGHCHQHAFDAVPDVAQVLSWVPGLEVAAAPAGCCGMGDGFGYRAEGHRASMRMGELGLLPAVRDADASTVIVSDGFGCRRQIADGAQRDAVHVARVLEAALPPAGVRPD
jgi:Fe-S oxidoreductase